MFLTGTLFILGYYFIKIKNNERGIFIINICLWLLILSSVIIGTISPVNNIFYKEVNTESSFDNLIEISYTDIDNNPYIRSVTNINGYKIDLSSNSNYKIGITSKEDDNIKDNIHGKLETKKINYKLKNFLIKLFFVVPSQKEFFIYDITFFENYN